MSASENPASEPEDTIMWKLPTLNRYESQRAFPQCELRSDSIVMTVNRDTVKVRCRNIAADSVQFRVDKEGAALIHPEGGPIAEGKGPILRLQTMLPLAGELKPLVAKVQVIYMTPRDENRIAVGARFLQVRPKDQASLDTYIREALRPA